MSGPQRKRAYVGAMSNESEKQKDSLTERIRKHSEIPEITIVPLENKNSDRDSGVTENGSGTSPSSTVSSPRFTVSPVESKKFFNSEKGRKTSPAPSPPTETELKDSSKVEEKTDSNVQKIVLTAPKSPPSSNKTENETSLKEEAEKQTTVTEDEATATKSPEDDETAELRAKIIEELTGAKHPLISRFEERYRPGSRKVSQVNVQPAYLTEDSPGHSQPASRKVSFLDDNHPGAVFYPGQFYLPGNVTPRKLSVESYYGYPQYSRKTSMDAFYLAPQQAAVNPKISVYSMGQFSLADSDKTFRDTLETLPDVDHYRDLNNVYDIRQRPTMFQLRDDEKPHIPTSPTSVTSELFEDELVDDDKDVEAGEAQKAASTGGLKFGWIQGVVVRCLLNIFGVMLFLRLTWVTGQAGVGLASIVILLSTLVTTITTMSMSAICTNGEVKGGGAYYMISRSLGPEFGGSIGVVFSLANAIAAAMYVVGFAETVRDIMWEYDAFITGDQLHEVRIIGCVTTCLLICIVLIGMEWEAKAQLGLLVILSAAILNYFIGSFIPPDNDKKWQGVVGYAGDVFSTNFGPSFTEGNSFFSVFAIFFPAATGILAGANISGDLKDPQSAIPKGTFLAIGLTSVIYLGMVWSFGGCIVRDAVGPVASTMLVTDIYGNVTKTLIEPTIDVISDCARLNSSCEYGLLNDNGVVGTASAFRPLILAGIFSATLSSALASMVGAPKVFQALGKDKLFPFIHYFSKGYGKSGEPRRGYFLTFFICLAMTCIGSLDLIAPIISNFFLMAYALINFSCFDASVANSPGFRPAFKYYNKWGSLLGSLLCLAVMFLINWWAALVTFVIVGALYSYVRIKKPDVNWGSSTQAHAYTDALKTTLHLVNVEEHVKNYRPQILLLSGFPRNRASLVDFASAITKRQSLLVCGQVFQGDMSEHLKSLRCTAAYKWFKNRKIRAFYNSVATPTFRIGVQVLLQALGVGKLRPNTLFLGYKSDWQKTNPNDVYDYFNVIQDAFDLNFGVGILRVPEGFDRNMVPDELIETNDAFLESDDESPSSDDEDKQQTKEQTQQSAEETKQARDGTKTSKSSNKLDPIPKIPVPKSSLCTAPPQLAANGGPVRLKRLNTLDEGIENLACEEEETNVDDLKRKVSESIMAQEQQQPQKALPTVDDSNCNRFKETQYGTIDVWWLFDDGGLTLLVPYILSQRKQWKNCKLRVFCVGAKKGNVTEEQMKMATLLAKFRIDYSQLTIVPDLSKKPQLSTYKEFASLINRWRLKQGEFPEEYMWKISDADLIAHKQRTYRNLRLREELQTHSKHASLIVMTLPVPRKTACPAGLYMGWLETLTKDMPPILLLRGNQESVLTYYS